MFLAVCFGSLEDPWLATETSHVNTELKWLAKKLQLRLICPKDILPGGLWLVNILANSSLPFFCFSFKHARSSLLGLLQSNPLSLKKTTDGATRNWRTLTSEFSLHLFGSYPWLFFMQSRYPSVQSGVDFPLVAVCREVGNSSMDLKRLNICNCCHRNVTVLVDVAFTLTMLFYFLFSLSSPRTIRSYTFCVELTMMPNSKVTTFHLNRLTDYKFEDLCTQPRSLDTDAFSCALRSLIRTL